METTKYINGGHFGIRCMERLKSPTLIASSNPGSLFFPPLFVEKERKRKRSWVRGGSDCRVNSEGVNFMLLLLIKISAYSLTVITTNLNRALKD